MMYSKLTLARLESAAQEIARMAPNTTKKRAQRILISEESSKKL